MLVTLRPFAAFTLASLWIGASTSDLGASSTGTAPPPGDVGIRLAQPEIAQLYTRPPGEVGGEGYARPQSDAAGLLLRIDRLESQLRQAHGEIEQLQFELRKVSERLEKFQQDVEFRFQESSTDRHGAPAPRPPQKRTDAQDYFVEPDASPPADPGLIAPSPRSSRRSDAFDPELDPNAPGVPRPLGSRVPAETRAVPTATQPTTATVGRGSDDPDAPLDLSSGSVRSRPGLAAPSEASPAAGGYVASRSPAREEFDVALAYLKQKEYENAEKSFTSFLQKNPNNKMAPDAVYYLGESYFQRGRQREAAEQYLKVSTRYVSSSRAPEALLRLGQSLNALGAHEQACAAYAEITRKYPNAAPTIKAGADREAKRAQC